MRTAPPLYCYPPGALKIHPGCNELWDKSWLAFRKERVAMPESVSDVVGNIKFMVTKMHTVALELPKTMCDAAVVTSLRKLENDTIGKLSDHFKDPLD